MKVIVINYFTTVIAITLLATELGILKMIFFHINYGIWFLSMKLTQYIIALSHQNFVGYTVRPA